LPNGSITSCRAFLLLIFPFDVIPLFDAVETLLRQPISEATFPAIPLSFLSIAPHSKGFGASRGWYRREQPRTVVLDSSASKSMRSKVPWGTPMSSVPPGPNRPIPLGTFPVTSPSLLPSMWSIFCQFGPVQGVSGPDAGTIMERTTSWSQWATFRKNRWEKGDRVRYP